MLSIMYGKTKSNQVPSDTQAREKLAMYVYEYLVHVGATKTANVFLQEIGWDKNISIGDSPGFLHSWWCVFWDLYCASPERRDNCEHSTEAKAFHDYTAASASSVSAMPNDGMGQQGIPPGYFPSFMSPRYPPGGPRPGMQGPGPQSMLQGMDHPRQGQIMGMGRMVHPRGIPPGSMNPYGPEQFQQPYGGMRMPASTMPGHGGMPMGPMPGRSWPNPSGPPGPASGVPPTTPMMRSPQDPMNSDYVHMNKAMSHQQMPSSFPMGGNGPESMPSTTIPMSAGPGLSVSTPNMTPGLNGLNGTGPDPTMIDGLPKNSPSNNMPMNTIGGTSGPTPMGPPGGPGGTPRTPQDGEGDSFNMGAFNDNHQDHNESAEILKIKETMQQEAKRFETKDNDGTGTNDFGF